MKESTTFVQALARAVSALSLYDRDHPSAGRALEQAFQAADDRMPDHGYTFTFLGEDVFCGETSLRSLRGWAWANRLEAIGIRRLEVDPGLVRSELEDFVCELAGRLSAPTSGDAAVPLTRRPHIRVGGGVTAESEPDSKPRLEAESDIALDEELGLLTWLHDEVAVTGSLPSVETHLAVTALNLAMHVNERLALPMMDPGHTSSPLVAHAMNVAVLGMAMGETLGCTARDVRAIGAAALLHDIGKARISGVRSGPPAPAADRTPVDSHAQEGARIILRSADLDLAAVVAYEHHLGPEGTGYPQLHFKRECHWSTRLVQVCNEYDHARWSRRSPVDDSPDQILLDLVQEAGHRLDAVMLRTLGQVVREGQPRRVSRT